MGYFQSANFREKSVMSQRSNFRGSIVFMVIRSHASADHLGGKIS